MLVELVDEWNSELVLQTLCQKHPLTRIKVSTSNRIMS